MTPANRTHSRENSFICWYCGQPKTRSEATTDEHIFLASLGGTLELSTRDVCDSCQKATGKLDESLPRNWFVASRRIQGGIARRGKIAIHNMGTLSIDRSEKFVVYSAGGPEKVISVTQTTDGTNRAILWFTADDNQQQVRAKRIVKERLNGYRILASQDDCKSEYDLELFSALLPNPWNFIAMLSDPTVVFVKTALALSCQVLGSRFISSPEAEQLRDFLWATNKNGYPSKLYPKLKFFEANSLADDIWGTAPHAHSIALITLDGFIDFHMTVFDIFCATIRICPFADYGDLMPSANNMDGYLWIIDPAKKQINGPLKALQRMSVVLLSKSTLEKIT